MRERDKLNMMAQLSEVQRAKRTGAEAALHAARSSEKEARREEEAARERTLAAQQQWLEHIGRSGFSPEYSSSLSIIVIARENEAAEAAVRTRIASDLCLRKQSDWQAQEARVRLSEDSVRRLRRKVERRREEDRLSEISDRITFDWCRR